MVTKSCNHVFKAVITAKVRVLFKRVLVRVCHPQILNMKVSEKVACSGSKLSMASSVASGRAPKAGVKMNMLAAVPSTAVAIMRAGIAGSWAADKSLRPAKSRASVNRKDGVLKLMKSVTAYTNAPSTVVEKRTPLSAMTLRFATVPFGASEVE